MDLGEAAILRTAILGVIGLNPLTWQINLGDTIKPTPACELFG